MWAREKERARKGWVDMQGEEGREKRCCDEKIVSWTIGRQDDKKRTHKLKKHNEGRRKKQRKIRCIHTDKNIRKERSGAFQQSQRWVGGRERSERWREKENKRTNQQTPMACGRRTHKEKRRKEEVQKEGRKEEIRKQHRPPIRSPY